MTTERELFPNQAEQRCTCGHTSADHNTPDALFEDTACLHTDKADYCTCERFTPAEQRTP